MRGRLTWSDLALAVTLVAGLVLDPLLWAHGAAVVLIFSAFALAAAPAAVRLAVAVAITALSSALHPVPLRDVLVQIPFVYGLSGLAIVLMAQLRSTRAAAGASEAAATAALGASEHRFRQLFQLDPVATALTRLVDNHILDVNASFSRLTGYDREELVGRAVERFDFFPDPGARARLVEQMRARQEVRGAEMTFRTKSGELRNVLASMELMDLDGEQVVVSSLLDISDRKRAEERLAEQVLHDHLTGLPNRVLLADRIEQAILAGQRDGTSFSLLYLDLNGFKQINDTFGHAAGDEVLQEVGRRLRSTLRATDTVARLAGDEFAILLPRASDVPTTAAVVMKMLAALREGMPTSGREVTITASVGAAFFPEHAQTADNLVLCADRAMYAAKQAGAECAVYSPEQDRSHQEQLGLIADLRDAVAREALALHYQPCVDLRTGACVAIEALARWPHPRRGLVPPGEFIPLAEGSGLITDLTAWALRRALADCARWHRDGNGARVAVNVSALDLRGDALITMVVDAIAAAQAQASWLELEITEAVAMSPGPAVLDLLERLRALGVHLAIDDFGTGYSSLAYLQRLPVDALKIDRSFVTDMPRLAGNAVIVASTIKLAHDFRLKTVAEGVEEKATWDELARLGCDVAQGYLIARPVPLDALLPWLAEHASGFQP